MRCAKRPAAAASALGHRLVGRDGGRGEMPGAPLARGAVRGVEEAASAPCAPRRCSARRGRTRASAAADGGSAGGPRRRRSRPCARPRRTHRAAGRAAPAASRITCAFSDSPAAASTSALCAGPESSSRRRSNACAISRPGGSGSPSADPAGQPVVADGGGDLERGQRVAVGGARERARRGCRRAAARPRRRPGSRSPSLARPVERQLLEAAARGSSPRPRRGRRRAARPADPARREPERLQRGAVDPLRVVDAHEHGRRRPRPRRAGRDGREHGEALDRLVGHRKRAAQGAACGGGRSAISASTRLQQLVRSRRTGARPRTRRRAARWKRMSAARARRRRRSIADLPTPGSPVSTSTATAPVVGRRKHRVDRGRARVHDRPARPEPTCAAARVR